jgi:hypothetical protein
VAQTLSSTTFPASDAVDAESPARVVAA